MLHCLNLSDPEVSKFVNEYGFTVATQLFNENEGVIPSKERVIELMGYRSSKERHLNASGDTIISKTGNFLNYSSSETVELVNAFNLVFGDTLIKQFGPDFLVKESLSEDDLIKLYNESLINFVKFNKKDRKYPDPTITEEKNAFKNKVLSDIISNFWDFVENHHKPFIQSYDASLVEPEDDITPNNESFKAFDAESSVEKISPIIKRFLSSIPKYKRSGVKDLDFGESTWLYIGTDFQAIQKIAMDRLSDIPCDWEIAKQKLIEVGNSGDSIKEFNHIVNIFNWLESQITKKTGKEKEDYIRSLQNLKTKFLMGLANKNYFFGTNVYDPTTGTYTYYSSSAERKEDNLLQVWKNNYFIHHQTLGYSKKVIGQVRENLEKARKLFIEANNYTNSGQSIPDDIKEPLLKALNNASLLMGITGLNEGLLLGGNYEDFNTGKKVNYFYLLEDFIDSIEKAEEQINKSNIENKEQKKITDIYDKTQSKQNKDVINPGLKALNLAKNLSRKMPVEGDFQHLRVDGSVSNEVQKYTTFANQISMINYAIDEAIKEVGDPNKFTIDQEEFKQSVIKNLLKYAPQTVNILSQYSQLFDIICKGHKLDVQVREQSKINNENDGAVFSDMTSFDREMQRLANTLEAKYHIRRSADRSVEWGFEVKGQSEFSGNKILEVSTPSEFIDKLINFFKGEIALHTAYNTNSILQKVVNFRKIQGTLPVLKSILIQGGLKEDDLFIKKIISLIGKTKDDVEIFFTNPDNLKTLNSVLSNFLHYETVKTYEHLEKLGFFERKEFKKYVDNKKKLFVWYKGIPARYTEDISNLKEGDPKIKETLFKIVQKYYMNDFLMGLEQDSMFFGYQGFYKSISDNNKRINMFNSTIERLRTDNEFLSYLINTYPVNNRNTIESRKTFKRIVTGDQIIKTDKKTLNLIKKQIIKKYVSDGMTEKQASAHFDKFIGNHYNELNSTDGTSKASLSFYRDLLLMTGRDTPKILKLIEQELNFLKDPENSPKPSIEDQTAILNVLKTICVAPIKELLSDNPELSVFVPYLEKKADDPIIPSAVYGTELFTLLKYLEETGITGVHFAPKAGQLLNNAGNSSSIFTPTEEEGKFPEIIKLFDEEGNPIDITNKVSIQSIDASNYAFSQETGNKVKETTPNAVQFRINIYANAFKGGVPTDYKESNWENLSEEEKEEKSAIYKDFKRYISLLHESVRRPFNETLKSLGWDGRDKGTRQKFVKVLIESAKQSASGQNVILGIKALADGITTMDFLVNYNEVSAMLFAHLKKNSIVEKRFGGSRIQTSEMGYNVQKDDNLKFYTISKKTGETLPCQIKLSLPKEWIPYVESVGGISEFNKLVKQTNDLFYKYHNSKSKEEPSYPVDINLLKVVGFRIPNQQFSSSDYALIQEFLPPITGETVVVSPLLLKKVGSDLDVDKLNVYLNNYILNQDTLAPEYIHPDEKTEEDYIRYVRSHMNENLDKVYEEKEEYWEELEKLELKKDINEIDKTITDDIKSNNKLIYKLLRNLPDKSYLKSFKTTKGIARYENLIKNLTPIAFNYGTDTDLLKQLTFLAIRQIDIIHGNTDYGKELAKDIFKYFNEKSEPKRKELYFDYIKRTATALNLLSFEDFQNNNSPEFLSERTLQNAITDYQIKRLSDPDNLGDLLTPISENNALKIEASKQEEVTGKHKGIDDQYKLYTPWYNQQLTQSYLVGKALVATTANHLKSHIVAQMADLFEINDNLPLLNTYNANLKEVITDKGTRNYVSYAGIISSKGERITETTSDFLTAFVDVAKDPYVFTLVDQNSLDTCLYLIRTGASREWALRFVASPIIKKYLNLKAQQQSITDDRDETAILDKLFGTNEKEESYNTLSKLINNLKRESSKNEPDAELVEKLTTEIAERTEYLNSHKYTEEELLDIIANGKEDLIILEQYLEYQRKADKLKNITINARPDSMQIKNPNELKEYFDKIEQTYEDGFFGNFSNMLHKGVLKEYNRVYQEISNKVVPDLYLTFNEAIAAILQPSKDKFINARRKGIKESEISSKIDKRFMLFLYQNLVNIFNPSDAKGLMMRKVLDEKGELVNNNHTLARKIIEIQRDRSNKLHSNLFLKAVLPILNFTHTENVKMRTRKTTTWAKDNIIKSLREVRETDKDFFNELLSVIMTQGGLENSNISLTQYIPNDILHTFVQDVFKKVKLSIDNIGMMKDVFDEILELSSPDLNPGTRDRFGNHNKQMGENTRTFTEGSKQVNFEYLYETTEDGKQLLFKKTGTTVVINKKSKKEYPAVYFTLVDQHEIRRDGAKFVDMKIYNESQRGLFNAALSESIPETFTEVTEDNDVLIPETLTQSESLTKEEISLVNSLIPGYIKSPQDADKLKKAIEEKKNESADKFDRHVAKEYALEQLKSGNALPDEYEEFLSDILSFEDDSQKPQENTHSFTYKNEKISTDFELTNDQSEALRKLIDFSEKDGYQAITLNGPAGTGKTTIISYLEKYLKPKGFTFVYMAPTHAATVELAFSILKSGNKFLPSTIASGIKTSVNRETGVKEQSFSKKITDRLGYNNIIVIDELSMVNSEDYDSLKKVARQSGVKLIFMGDVLQIPEVTPSNPKEKQVSKGFSESEHDQVYLTEIKRTDSNEMLNILSNVRKTINEKIPQIENTDRVQFLDISDFNRKIIEYFKNDPENTVLINYTNEGVKNENLKIRTALGKTGDLKKGDIIVGFGGYNTKQIEKGNIANSVRYTVTEVRKEGSAYVINATSSRLDKLREGKIKNVTPSATGYYLQLNRSDSFDFENLTEKDFEENNSKLSNLFRELYLAKREALKNPRGWSNYYNVYQSLGEKMASLNVGGDYIYNPESDRMEKYSYNEHKNIFPELRIEKGVDYGYAVTIHKSQGTTIRNVFFNTPSLPKFATSRLLRDKEFVSTEKHSLLYVALSRASEKLFINSHDNSNFYQLSGNKPSIPNNKENTIAVIGTAGRSIVPTKEDWNNMLEDAESRVSKNDTLISGGAAFADHIAVKLFLEGKVKGLKLRLPAPFKDGKFEGLKDKDRKSTRLNSSHVSESRMPSSA